MLRAYFKKYTLFFKEPGGTSRGILVAKDSWFIIINTEDSSELLGIGECSIIRGLSIDDRPDFEQKLQQVCDDILNWQYWLEEGLFEFPSIRFGLEMAIKNIIEGEVCSSFPSLFTEGKESIPINGLVWMGDYNTMRNRIIEKLDAGYKCVKLKVGAINFDDEVKLLQLIRKDFGHDDIELRLDANGAFSAEEALEKLKILSNYSIHSIEQPIGTNQWDSMAGLCSKSPIPIALDEELIGVYNIDEIRKMFEVIAPQYIILKPGLLGGWSQCGATIREAENQNIGWWVTSALESNIGLNAIAQWAYTLNNPMPQGLGTGQLFTNNIPSPLKIEKGSLYYDSSVDWKLDMIINE